MKRLCLLLLLLPLWASAFEARYTGSSDPVRPKSLVALPIELVSDTNATLKLEMELPQGWKQISQPGMISVEAGQARRLLLNVSVPAFASADHTHAIQLHFTGSTGEILTLPIELEVAAVAAISATILKYEPVLWSGSERVLELEVSNGGNQETPVHVHAESTSVGWAIEPPHSDIRVPARGSTLLKLRALAPSDIPQETVGQLRISVTHEETLKQVRASLRAVPKPPPPGRTYPVLPSRLEVKGLDIGQDGFPRTRVAFLTSGQISEHRSVYVDYQDTYFNDTSTGSSGNERYYNVALEHVSGWAIVGGHTEARFAALPRDVEGEGVRFTLQRPTRDLVVFYGRKHNRSIDGLREHALAVNSIQHFGRRSFIEGTYEYFDDRAAGGMPSLHDRHVGHLRARAQLTQGIHVLGEAAVSHKEMPIDQEVDYAWLAQAGWNSSWGAINGQIHRVGTDFPGRLEDQEGYRIHITSRWDFPFSLWAKHRYLRDNVSRLATLETLKTWQYSVGSYFRYGAKWPDIGIIYDFTDQNSDSLDAANSDDKHSINITWHKGIGRYHFSGRSKWEWLSNDLTKEKGCTDDTYLDIATQWRKADLSFRGRWQHSTARTLNPRLHSYRATCQYPLGPGMILGRAKLQLRKNQTEPKSTTTQSYEAGYLLHGERWTGDLRYQYKYVNGDPSEGNGRGWRHRVRSFLGYSITDDHHLDAHLDFDRASSGANEVSFVLTYTTYFGIPLPFMKNRSEVHGRMQATDGTLFPMTRVLLEDRQTYTDEDGTYRFVNLRKGTYTLDADTTRIASRWTPSGELPREVVVEPGISIQEDILLEKTQAPPEPEEDEEEEEDDEEPEVLFKRFEPITL